MSTDLAVHTGSSLAITTEQDGFTAKQVAALRQLGVKDAGEGDLAVFFHHAQRTGLDPFAKQIYLIGRWSREGTKYTIQTGIDGYRLIARRAVDRRGESLGYEETLWCDQNGNWTDVWLSSQPPAAAKVVVLRNGQRYPATALWSEYVQTTKDGSPNSMWARMGAGQLAKCAEALALRKAFPQDLSGIYTTDEMGQSENPAPQQQAVKPQSIRQAIGSTSTSIRSEAQSKKLAILLRELGMNDRAEALAYIGGVVGREVESTKTLTVAEASKLIDNLEHARDDSANPATGEVVDAEIIEPDDAWPTVSGVQA